MVIFQIAKWPIQFDDLPIEQHVELTVTVDLQEGIRVSCI